MAILEVQPITALDAPELEPYRTMKRAAEHRKQRIFVAEGDKVVLRLLDTTHYEVVSVLLPQKWFETLEPVLKARPEGIQVFTADRNLLEQLTGFSMYQGVLAVGRIPAPESMEAILARSAHPYLLVAVEDLTNAENMGGLVRNCVGFGATAMVVGETCSSPFLRRSVRSSMGTLFQLPVIESEHLAHTLMHLRRMGIRNLAAHPRAQHVMLPHADLAHDCCLVFGSEGFGLSETLVDLCDAAVAIPMANQVDSLNVACASSIFLYEAARQQGKI